MSRHRRCRRVGFQPHITSFGPVGTIDLANVSIAVDEIEAIRLKDLEGLEQEKAAKMMGISQPTFHRVLEIARKKVARAIVEGKVLRIGGGVYELKENKDYVCYDCNYGWEVGYSTPSPMVCVNCESKVGDKNERR